jgi:arylsulfatase
VGATNTPFRYWKAQQYEGGAHTPCIAHWPAGLDVSDGAFVDSVGHVMDILPTCLDLAEVEYPDRFNGHDITPLDGKSLTPILAGEEREGHDQIFFEHVGGKAIMEDDWKLVTLRREGAPWRLYDLAADPTETTDRADDHPDRVEKMKADWRAWAREVGVEGVEPTG